MVIHFSASDMNAPDERLSGYCSQTFVILDKWLNEIGKAKGEESLEIVRHALHNNIKANVTYYEGIAVEAQKIGQTELANRNKLLAKLYKGLLE